MTNQEIKYYEKLKQKKYRDSEKLFIIEGVHLIEECIKSELYKELIDKIIIRNDFNDIILLKKLNKYIIKYINSIQFKKIAETVNSQGIAGIVKMREFKETDAKIYTESGIIVALENINDPGNLGTILRTCYWFGIKEVLISKNSVDIYNPKVIRASQGAIFNIRIQNEINLTLKLKDYQNSGYNIIFTTLDTKIYLNEFSFRKNNKYIIVFGNEANGISDELRSSVSHTDIKIKSFSECDSLNLATSAGIVLFEATK